MAPATADRYLRTGGPVPVIYPGNLKELNLAQQHALWASASIPGDHYVIGIYGRKHQVLQRLSGGRVVWAWQPAQEEM